jgi:hypothetical protein
LEASNTPFDASNAPFDLSNTAFDASNKPFDRSNEPLDASTASSLGFSDLLHQPLQPLPKLHRQPIGNRRHLPRGDLVEKGGKVGKRRRQPVELGKRFFLARAKAAALPKAGLGTGNGQGLQGLEHLGGQTTASSSALFELGEQVIALLGPPGGSGEVAAGLGDLGEGVVVLPSFLEAKGFVNLAGFVGMALGSREIAEVEKNICELPQGTGFMGLVAKTLPDPQAFLY